MPQQTITPGGAARSTGSSRPRHVMPVRALVCAWEQVSDDERTVLAGTLPRDLLDPLLRLVDPRGLQGHADASRLAAAYRRLAQGEVEQLSRALPFPLFWALARLAQNLG